jgi:hypothetical protein
MFAFDPKRTPAEKQSDCALTGAKAVYGLPATKPIYFRYWHLADIAQCTAHVRYRG